ncbi:MAG TPA: lysine transporter LysE [Methanomicrobia archaeon]|nr:lysine transporter LysE [Methanomicrobia archaeon]
MDLIASPILIGASLLAIGFFTGLSGALIPGPMLAYVLADTVKKGARSGPLTVLGHISVELALILALVLGLGITSYFLEFKSLVYVMGGIALILISVTTFRSARGAPDDASIAARGNTVRWRGFRYAYHSSIAGGILFTAFNPAFIPWWVTVGYPLLLQGFEWFAVAGIALVSIGHFMSDLTWYSFVSYSFSRGERFLVGKRYERIMLGLALFVITLGVFFFIKGVTGLI